MGYTVRHAAAEGVDVRPLLMLNSVCCLRILFKSIECCSSSLKATTNDNAQKHEVQWLKHVGAVRHTILPSPQLSSPRHGYHDAEVHQAHRRVPPLMSKSCQQSTGSQIGFVVDAWHGAKRYALQLNTAKYIFISMVKEQSRCQLHVVSLDLVNGSGCDIDLLWMSPHTCLHSCPHARWPCLGLRRSLKAPISRINDVSARRLYASRNTATQSASTSRASSELAALVQQRRTQQAVELVDTILDKEEPLSTAPCSQLIRGEPLHHAQADAHPSLYTGQHCIVSHCTALMLC